MCAGRSARGPLPTVKESRNDASPFSPPVCNDRRSAGPVDGRSGTATSTAGLNLQSAGNSFRVTGTPRSARRGAQICTTESVQMNFLKQNSFNLFIPPSAAIFPGSFIDARTMLQLSPAVISAPNRAPLTIRLDISNPLRNAPDTTITSDFGGSNLAALDGNLLNRHFGAAFPARIIARTEEVRSTIEMSARAEVAYGVLLPLQEFGIPAEVGAAVQGSVAASSLKQTHSYMMTIVQPMYSYSVTTVDKNRFFTAPGSPALHPNALMVSSVTFGRRVTILVQSEEDQSTVEATVRARLGLSVTGDAGGVFELGGRAEGAAIARFNRQISRFVATFYGGNSGRANAVIADPAQVAAYLTDPSAAALTAVTTAVPIEYRLEPVSTNGVVGVRSDGNFDSSACEEPVYEVAVQYLGLRAIKVVEAPFDDKEDVFGSVSVNGKVLKTIPESQAQSIRAGSTSEDDITIVVDNTMTLADLQQGQLRFTESLKDWEAAFKPAFSPVQPADLIYNLGDRLDVIANLPRDGVPRALDSRVQEIRLFENADAGAAGIAVRYKVLVKRR